MSVAMSARHNSKNCQPIGLKFRPISRTWNYQIWTQKHKTESRHKTTPKTNMARKAKQLANIRSTPAKIEAP